MSGERALELSKISEMSEDSLASEIGPGTPNWMMGSMRSLTFGTPGSTLNREASSDAGQPVDPPGPASAPDATATGTALTDDAHRKMVMAKRLRERRAVLKEQQRSATERSQQQPALPTQVEQSLDQPSQTPIEPSRVESRRDHDVSAAPAPSRGSPGANKGSISSSTRYSKHDTPGSDGDDEHEQTAAANNLTRTLSPEEPEGVQNNPDRASRGRFSETTQILSDNDDVLQDTLSTLNATGLPPNIGSRQTSSRAAIEHSAPPPDTTPPTATARDPTPQRRPAAAPVPRARSPGKARTENPPTASHGHYNYAAASRQPAAAGPTLRQVNPTTTADATPPRPTAIEAALRGVVHEALSSADVQSKIRECTMRVIREGKLAGLENEDQVLDHLLHEGLLQLVQDQCRSNIASHGAVATGARGTARYYSQQATPASSSGCSLLFSALQGKAFLEYADVSSEHYFPDESPTFTLFAFFQGQRLCSPAVPCGCDPFFNHQFVFELPADVDNPFLLDEPVHVVLVQSSPSSHPGCSPPELVAVQSIHWQDLILGRGGSSRGESRISSIELMGVGSAVSIPAGVLELRATLHRGDEVEIDLESALAKFKTSQEAAVRRERLFLLYAKQWWKEYVDIRPSHRERTVKIFAPNELGRNRLICLAVGPIQPGRLIDTPMQAARFVSLIPHAVTRSVGRREEAKVEQWSHAHTILSRGCGDVEDHTTLLCGLFLGLGLDAYVCAGTKFARTSSGRKVQVAHTWVATFGASDDITFWESLTGARWQCSIERTATSNRRTAEHHYATIGCIFNHKTFLANVQPGDLIVDCSFDLRSPQNWKAMSRDAIRSAGPPIHPLPITLLPNTVNTLAAADHLESELRAQIAQYRRNIGLGITWNSEVSQILVQCLAAYEMEKSTGSPCNTSEFQYNIKRAIPKGHTFKGYPLQFGHSDASTVMEECARDPTSVEVLRARGDHVKHSLHVKIFPYPEDTIAVWVMLAVTFRSVL